VNKAGPRSSIPVHGRDDGAVERVGSADPRSAAAGRRGEEVDDRELVVLAQGGDREAFRTLFERYHRRAYGLAFGVVRQADDALDIVQDAFIKAHKHLDKFEGSSGFYTWLYRIVMNLAIDHLRKLRRARPVELDEARLEEPAGLDGGLLPMVLGGQPGRALLDKEIRARIDAALAELSDNHRAVLVMRELEGMTYEEMAEAMRCSKGTIMSRLFHARKNMQRRLADLVEAQSRGAGERIVRDSDEMPVERVGSADPRSAAEEIESALVAPGRSRG
jgi:RNA polymerase sigma-70 factor, ECF subfamily